MISSRLEWLSICLVYLDHYRLAGRAFFIILIFYFAYYLLSFLFLGVEIHLCNTPPMLPRYMRYYIKIAMLVEAQDVHAKR